MLKLLKVFGRGVLTTLLLPVILLVWVLYGVYCIGLFVFMFFKSTIEYFQGKTFDADLPEDFESKRILLEKEKANEQARDALSMMYQNAMSQAPNQQPAPTEQNSSSTEENIQSEEVSSEQTEEASESSDME